MVANQLLIHWLKAQFSSLAVFIYFLCAKHSSPFWGHKWNFYWHSRGRGDVHSIWPRKIPRDTYQLELSKGIASKPNRDHMQKLRPQGVYVPTNPIRETNLLVFHLLGLGFLMFMVSSLFFYFKKGLSRSL